MTEAATARASTERAGATIEARGLSRTYDGRITAVRDVSLQIGAGEFVSISGPSGSGKSTLLQLLGGLDRPDAGEILIDGAPLGDHGSAIDVRRHVVGFVFQLHYLLPAVTAQGNVEVALMPLHVPRRERRARAAELLDEVGLSHRGSHLPAQLSGGERQRVAIARALANHPRLLLADEPTGALDSEATTRVLDLLARLQRRHGMTLIVVTHDDAVSARADRRLHVVDGRIVRA